MIKKKGVLLRFNKKTEIETDLFFEVFSYLINMKLSYRIKDLKEANRKDSIRGIDFFVITNNNLVIPIQISFDPRSQKAFEKKGIKVFLFKINKNLGRNKQIQIIREQIFWSVYENLLV